MFRISHTGKLSMIWNYLEILMCVMSSYYYAYLSLFCEMTDIQLKVIIGLDIYFAVAILKAFLTDFTPENKNKPETNLFVIAKRYLHHEFPLDLILWVPLWLLIYLDINYKLLFILKCWRIVKGLNNLFNVSTLMKQFKTYLIHENERQIEKNPAFGDDQTEDHNFIERLTVIQYVLIISKLVI